MFSGNLGSEYAANGYPSLDDVVLVVDVMVNGVGKVQANHALANL